MQGTAGALGREYSTIMQRILVVDDDPTVTSVLKRGLSYEGFAVDTASSGAEGLSIVSITHDFRARTRCYELIAEALLRPS